jgi:hypothetical protein
MSSVAKMKDKPRCYPIVDPDGVIEEKLRSQGRWRTGIPLTRRAGPILWVERLPQANPFSEGGK